MRRAASVRLLRDAFVERGDDGGLLFFREALGRLFREHASIATQELSFQTEDGHEDAAEDGVGAVEDLRGIEPMSHRRLDFCTGCAPAT